MVDNGPDYGLDDGSQVFEGPVPGKVVDREDPTKSNQIKVRVKHVYGEINKDSLPWAPPISGGSVPLGGPSAGDPPKEFGQVHVPYEGSWVAVYFVDGDHMEPVYGGAMPPEKSTPKRFRGKEDDIFQTIQDNLVDDDITELEAKLSGYPDVHGTLYSSGILFEINEKDGEERLLWFHPSGWRQEVMPNGDHVIHVENTQQMIVMSDQEIYVGGSLTEIIKKNVTRKVEGNFEETIKGTETRTVEKAVDETFNAKEVKTISGKSEYDIGDVMNRIASSGIQLQGSGINLSDIIQAILDHILAHTHPTPVGPTGTPINSSDFQTDKNQTSTWTSV